MSARNWHSFTPVARVLNQARAYLQFLNGDQAYARYLAHWQNAHVEENMPLSRAEFYQRELQRRWNSVRRCC